MSILQRLPTHTHGMCIDFEYERSSLLGLNPNNSSFGPNPNSSSRPSKLCTSCLCDRSHASTHCAV